MPHHRCNPPLSTTEIADISVRSLRLRAFKTIGLSELELLTGINLLICRGPITCSSLSYLTGYSRRSVTTTLLDFQLMRMAIKWDVGWVLSEMGNQTLRAIMRQSELIGRGKLLGFSSVLKDHLAGLPTEGVKRPFRVVG